MGQELLIILDEQQIRFLQTPPGGRKHEPGLAAAMVAGGFSFEETGRLLDVTGTAVRMSTNPTLEQAARAKNLAWAKEKVPCSVCGGPRKKRTRGTVCRACLPSNVRPGLLRCVTCRRWKPDDQFSPDRSKPARRGMSSSCRPCTAERGGGFVSMMAARKVGR